MDVGSPIIQPSQISSFIIQITSDENIKSLNMQLAKITNELWEGKRRPYACHMPALVYIREV